MQKQKVKKTIEYDKDLIEKVKAIANRNNTTQTTVLNRALKKGLLLELQSEKLENTKGDSFLKLAGMVSAKEPFSALEEIKKMRNCGA